MITKRNFHGAYRADAREGIDHQFNQRPIAQSNGCSHVDAIEHGARVARVQHRRLANFDDVLGPRTLDAGLVGPISRMTSLFSV